MKKTFVIILGLMLGFTSVFGQDNDVDNVVSSVLRYYAHVMGALEDTYDNSRQQKVERVSNRMSEEWLQAYMSYYDVFDAPYIKTCLDCTYDPLDIPEFINELRDMIMDHCHYAFVAGAISQYNLSHGTDINIRNKLSLCCFPSDAKIKYDDIEDLEIDCLDDTMPISKKDINR
jgi:hypothetical protein